MTRKENFENKSPLNPHLLEGKYIICSYTEQDQEPEDGFVPEPGTALALYKLKKGKLEEIYHPRDHFMFVDAECMNNDGLIDFMERQKITKVFNVISKGDFFDLKRYVDLDGRKNRSELVGKYCRYDPLDKKSEEDKEIFVLLKKNGIKVRSYDEDKKQFLH